MGGIKEKKKRQWFFRKVRIDVALAIEKEHWDYYFAGFAIGQAAIGIIWRKKKLQGLEEQMQRVHKEIGYDESGR